MYSKHFQDPTRVLLDPMVEYVRWSPYFELEALKFLRKEMREGNEQKDLQHSNFNIYLAYPTKPHKTLVQGDFLAIFFWGTADARFVFCFTVKHLPFGLYFNHESSYKRTTLENH